jgi:hypothetical protein
MSISGEPALNSVNAYSTATLFHQIFAPCLSIEFQFGRSFHLLRSIFSSFSCNFVSISVSFSIFFILSSDVNPEEASYEYEIFLFLYQLQKL